MAPRVSVIVPTFNGLPHLQACLPALAAQTFTDHEVIVVDNGSTDGTLDWLNAERVRVIELGSNLGFSAAVNAGILASQAPFIALLNNDTRPEPRWLESIVHALEATPRAASAASLLVQWDDPSIVDAAGDTYSMWRGAGLSHGQGKPTNRYLRARMVFGACAAAAVYRAELFETIGLFDSDFFLLHEDTDMSLRATAAGHRCIYVPDAVVAHRRGASTTLDPQLASISLRNRIWAAARSLPPGLWTLWCGCFVLRLIGMRLTRRTSSHAAPAAPLRTLTAAFRQVPAKRRGGRPLRRTSSLRMLLWIR